MFACLNSVILVVFFKVSSVSGYSLSDPVRVSWVNCSPLGLKSVIINVCLPGDFKRCISQACNTTRWLLSGNAILNNTPPTVNDHMCLFTSVYPSIPSSWQSRQEFSHGSALLSVQTTVRAQWATEAWLLLWLQHPCWRPCLQGASECLVCRKRLFSSSSRSLSTGKHGCHCFLCVFVKESWLN